MSDKAEFALLLLLLLLLLAQFEALPLVIDVNVWF